MTDVFEATKITIKKSGEGLNLKILSRLGGHLRAVELFPLSAPRRRFARIRFDPERSQ